MPKVIIDPKDYRYFVKTPVNFSPERNKAIVQETIKETTEFFDNLQGALDQDIMNRIDVVGTYGRYRFNQGTKDIKQYLGPKMYESLVGEKIMSKIRVLSSADKMKGNTKILL